ncbi:Uncharacterized protein BM_BM8541 [Brugia malayi]|uniref:F-box domain-containing protein n=1 Tax=Brugia malayi TaxID=6279 RepID=A0A4E9FS09_BRUMA|nr:Uncharacterized protein BM_BM8541 [Brugia malayi]VIO99547.1 Uncharacterized protein BM_BM8541 [Brugia malayi]
MLRQLLSATNGVSSSNALSSDYDHCSLYPLSSRNFENSTMTSPLPSLSQPSLHLSQSQLLPQLPSSSSSSSASSSSSSSSSSASASLSSLSSSSSSTSSSSSSVSASASSSASSLSLPLSLSPASTLPSTDTVSISTSQNQFRINDKNLITTEYMSLAAGYGMQTPIISNHLEILDTNNDLNDTTELFSSTYAMLSADSTLSWNVWDEQTRFSNSTNDFTSNQVPMSINNHNFGYPIHTTIPGCSNNIRYQTCNTNRIDNNYTTNCHELINDNRLELQQQQQQLQLQQQQQQQLQLQQQQQQQQSMQQHAVVLPIINESRNYGQQEKCTENLSQITQLRFSDSNQKMMNHATGRNYLDQMGGSTGNIGLCEPGNITNSNGIDPVCPYCDRFISHYKGNIRRHVNQCMRSTRNGNKLKRKDTILKQFTSDTNQFNNGCNDLMIFSDNYQPNVLETSMTAEKAQWLSNFSDVLLEQNSIIKTKLSNTKRDRSNDDPFRCPLCDFATIYKGNMKRHLSTCHGLQDDDLKDGCIDKMKYKEVIESRLENGSRNKRPRNLQHLKVTSKLSEIVSDNATSSSSTITDCNTMKMISEVAIADEALSTFPVISSSFINCKQEQFALSLINSSADNIALEAGKEGSLSEMTEISSNDNTNQFMRLNTIDETIEAVIANGNENSINKMAAAAFSDEKKVKIHIFITKFDYAKERYTQTTRAHVTEADSKINSQKQRNYARLFNNESMSTLQNENGNDIVQDESKGLLSLLDEIIIHIIEKLNSEDIANIADTCIRLREIVRKMTAGDESLSDFSIESIDELDCK